MFVVLRKGKKNQVGGVFSFSLIFSISIFNSLSFSFFVSGKTWVKGYSYGTKYRMILWFNCNKGPRSLLNSHL